jgi:LPXTG-site transpeptidase (sortase) family protein
LALSLIGFTVLAILVVYSVLFDLGPIARAIGVGVAAVEAQQPVVQEVTNGAASPADVATEPASVPTLSAQVPPPVPYATPTLPSEPTPVPAPPTRLAIPRISLDVPVESVGYTKIIENGESKLVWDTLPHSASFHNSSAYLGEDGNTVINGHRDLYSSIFRQLNKLEEGDRIELYAGDVPYVYQVVGVRVLPYVGATVEDIAEHARLMGRTYESRLTLITCTPVALATHRLYVIAEPLEG